MKLAEFVNTEKLPVDDNYTAELPTLEQINSPSIKIPDGLSFDEFDAWLMADHGDEEVNHD